MPCLFIFADTWSTFFFGGRGVTSILEGMELTLDAFAIHKNMVAVYIINVSYVRGPTYQLPKPLVSL